MSSDLLYVAVVAICAIEVFTAGRALHDHIVRFFLFLGVGLIHGVVPLMGPSYALGAWRPSPDALRAAPPLVLAGVAAMALAWRIADHVQSRGHSRPLSELVQARRSQTAVWRIAVSAGVLGLVATIGLFVSSAGSLSAFTEGPRFAYRARGGLVALVCLQFVALAFVPGFMAFVLSGRRRIACLLYAGIYAPWYYFATHGTRSVPLGVLAAILFGYILMRRPDRRAALLTVIGVVLGMMLMSGLYTVRKELSNISVGTAAVRLLSMQTYRDAINTDPLNYHGQFLAAIDHFPSQQPYLDGATYRRIVFLPVPEGLVAGLRPQDTHLTFAQVVLSRDTTVTIPPSIPGDAYINVDGAMGVPVMMALWGVLGSIVDGLLRRKPWWILWLGPELARLLLLFLRGQPFEVAVIGAFTWAALFLLAKAVALPRVWKTDRQVVPVATGSLGEVGSATR